VPENLALFKSHGKLNATSLTQACLAGVKALGVFTCVKRQVTL